MRISLPRISVLTGVSIILLFASSIWSQDNSHMVVIRGNTPPPLKTATPAGHKNAGDVLEIVVGLKTQNEKDLDDLILRQHDSNSPDYAQWITSDEFLTRYAPAESEVEKVVQYLGSNGLTVSQVTPNRMLIQAHGTVSQIEQAFRVNINDYELNRKQEFSNDRDPSVPTSLANVVQSVMGLDSISRVYGLGNVNRHPNPLAITYTPWQIATTYNFPTRLNTFHGGTLYDGSGVTIAIATAYTYLTSDVQFFWNYYTGIQRSGTLTNIPVNGSTTTINFEPTLDVEWAGGEAPGANLLVYETPDSSFSNFTLMYNQIVSDNLASVVSISWVACEAEMGSATLQSQDAAFKQGAAKGITFFVGSGDDGAYAETIGSTCTLGSNSPAVDYPSSDPYITSVGGTSLTANSNYQYVSESAWTSSGGAASSFFPLPSWQVGPGVPKNSNRDISDVAFDADGNTGYYVYYNSGWFQNSYGTSFGGPNWAALWALGTQAISGKRTGQIAPLLYKLGASGAYHQAIHDVTTGSNGNGHGPGYNAGPYWDYPTGWGSPNGASLINLLVKHH